MVENKPPTLCKDTGFAPKLANPKDDSLRISMSVDLTDVGFKAKTISAPVQEVPLTKRKGLNSLLHDVGLQDYQIDFSSDMNDEIYSIESKNIEKHFL
jgi:hypothetical protein